MGERRIVFPPPPRRPYSLQIVAEIPGELGGILWQAAGRILKWVDTPSSDRGGLFRSGSSLGTADFRRDVRAENGELADALDRLDLLAQAPLAISPAQLAESCRNVALWADANGHSETAVFFAEAAAMVQPIDPHLANTAACLTRNAAEYSRAEVWFERGIGLARASRNRIEFTRGHIGYGILWQTLGRDRRARRHFTIASRRAMKDGREWLAAEAQHDLLLMAAERGQYRDAELHARTALAWYPKYHERFPFFVADFAFLLVSEHEYDQAVRLLGEFLRAVREPSRRVLGLSVLVRALGGMHERKRFDRARRRLLRLLERFQDCEPAARINLAEGERALGMWIEAEANARIALDVAERRRDAVPERLARSLLVQIADRVQPVSATIPSDTRAALIADAEARLRAWVPSRRGRRPRTQSGEGWAVA